MSVENNLPKSKSGRGGARKGAGRKPGSANLKTRAIANKAAKEGLTPLEVMLDAMTALHRQANALADGDEAEMGGRKVNRLGLLVSAAEVAKDAAPYMHPRLQAIEHSGSIGAVDRPPLTDFERASRLATILQRARANAAAILPPATAHGAAATGSTDTPSANRQASMRLVGASVHVSATESTGGAS